MSIDRQRHHRSSRRQRLSRSSSRELPGIRNEELKLDSESSHVPTTPHRSARGPASRLKGEGANLRREKRRSQGRRSQNSLPSPPTETPITAVLGDLRDDIEETNFSPQHSSTFYGDARSQEDAVVRGRPHGPVYVQNRTGFSQIDRDRAFDCPDGRDVSFWGYWHQTDKKSAPPENKPVHLAINVQSCWTPFATFCHGTLAGVSLMQTIFVEIIALTTANNFVQFASIYGKLSQLFSSLVYILISLCFISVFDWMDISHADCRLFVDFCNTRPRVSWLLVPLYSVALILTFFAARTDDWLASNAADISWAGNGTFSPNDKTELEMFEVWRILNVVRCTCVVLGWLIIATGRPKDLLLQHLKTMLRPVTTGQMP